MGIAEDLRAKRGNKSDKYFDMLEKKWTFHTAVAVILLASATGIGLLFKRMDIPDTNIVLLYILAVLVTSRLTRGYFYGLASSVAATLTFNYFFTDPYFSLNVNDPSYLITFVIMTAAAFVTSTLTSRVKQNALEAVEREKETLALYHLTSRLTEARDIQQAAGIAAEAVSLQIGKRAVCLFLNGKEELERPDIPYYEEGRFQDFPIYGEKGLVGVMMLEEDEGENLKEVQQRFLRSLLECTALAMDRIASAEKQARSQQEVIQERYRGNLLRAISHDLRTPLSGIMGTAEMILDMSKKEDPRYELAVGIRKDAEWLFSLVENILSLTRIEDGRMEIHKELEAAEEIVGGAIARMAGRAPEYEISVKVPDDVLMIPMDARLIMQVLINLLDNAIKHTPADKEISVIVEKDEKEKRAVFRIQDRGEGISDQDLPNIFESFYTSQTKLADARKGIGLGLAICESIVKAHGGSIGAGNREDGPGAEFVFQLPLEVKMDELVS